MLSALHVGMFIGTWNVFMYNLLAFFSPSPPSPHLLSFIHPTRQSKGVSRWCLCRSDLLTAEGIAAFLLLLNPSTPMSDQDRISPYNINTISTR